MSYWKGSIHMFTVTLPCLGRAHEDHVGYVDKWVDNILANSFWTKMAKQMVIMELLTSDCGKDCKGMLKDKFKKIWESQYLFWGELHLIFHCALLLAFYTRRRKQLCRRCFTPYLRKPWYKKMFISGSVPTFQRGIRLDMCQRHSADWHKTILFWKTGERRGYVK